MFDNETPPLEHPTSRTSKNLNTLFTNAAAAGGVKKC